MHGVVPRQRFLLLPSLHHYLISISLYCCSVVEKLPHISRPRLYASLIYYHLGKPESPLVKIMKGKDSCEIFHACHFIFQSYHFATMLKLAYLRNLIWSFESNLLKPHPALQLYGYCWQYDRRLARFTR